MSPISLVSMSWPRSTPLLRCGIPWGRRWCWVGSPLPPTQVQPETSPFPAPLMTALTTKKRLDKQNTTSQAISTTITISHSQSIYFYSMQLDGLNYHSIFLKNCSIYILHIIGFVCCQY